jgi:hypothetical protein
VIFDLRHRPFGLNFANSMPNPKLEKKMSANDISDQDYLLSGPGSQTRLDPETIRIRDAIIQNFKDKPISEINELAKKVLSVETDPIKRLGMLAARLFLLRHRIMNIKDDAADTDQLAASALGGMGHEAGDASLADDDDDAGSDEWVRVRMLEQAEMNGMRFFEGIIVDVRVVDANKLIESGRAEIVAPEAGKEEEPDPFADVRDAGEAEDTEAMDASETGDAEAPEGMEAPQAMEAPQDMEEGDPDASPTDTEAADEDTNPDAK